MMKRKYCLASELNSICFSNRRFYECVEYLVSFLIKSYLFLIRVWVIWGAQSAILNPVTAIGQ